MALIIEEAVEAFEEFADEAVEEVGEEVGEEVAEAIAEARAEVQELSSESSFIKECIEYVSTGIKDLASFVAKNAAIGVILWGVNVALAKLFPKGHEQGEKQKYDLIKAVIQVINTEICISKTTAQWLKDHKDDMVTLDGIEIPLDSIFYKYTKPVSDAIDEAYSVAKSLETADVKDKYKIPNAGDIQKFLTAADAFLNAFSSLVAFINQNLEKFPDLCSFPVKEDDINNLRKQIEIVKALQI